MDEKPERTSWSNERAARLGYLIGLGWPIERIAADYLIKSTPNNVYQRAQKFGLSFKIHTPFNLFEKSDKYFEAAAEQRYTTKELFLHKLLTVIADLQLVDEILDDIPNLYESQNTKIPKES